MIKKIIFISFLMLFGVSFMTIQAQNTSIGLRSGLNFSNVSGKNISNAKLRGGINFGVLLTRRINSHFGITGEVNFTQKGSKFEDKRILSIPLNYLEVPIYGVYYFGDSEADFRPKVFAGTFLGMLMTAKYKRDDYQKSLKNQRKLIEVGSVFGVGIQKRIRNNHWISIDLRYNLGLSNTQKEIELYDWWGDPVDTAPFKPIRNNVISLNVAYTFPLGNN